MLPLQTIPTKSKTAPQGCHNYLYMVHHNELPAQQFPYGAVETDNLLQKSMHDFLCICSYDIFIVAYFVGFVGCFIMFYNAHV